MRNKAINPLTKHIYIAIAILVLAISSAFGIPLLLPKVDGIIGVSTSVALALVGFGFSYYQFFYNKIESKKRRLEELKLIAYKDIMKECNELVYNANKKLGRYLKRGKSIKTNDQEATSILINSPDRIHSSIETIKYYEVLLGINIDYKQLIDLIAKIAPLQSIDQTQAEKYYWDLCDLKIAFNIFLLKTLISPNLKK